MNTTTPVFPSMESLVKPFQFPASPYEYKVTALRECPTPENLQHCDTPDKAADYWRMHIATHPQFNPECECLVVLLLNTRKKVKGHQLVSIGTQDTLLVHPREIFRVAIMTRRQCHRCHAQPPKRRKHPIRSRHQSDPRFNSRRSAFENGSH